MTSLPIKSPESMDKDSKNPPILEILFSPPHPNTRRRLPKEFTLKNQKSAHPGNMVIQKALHRVRPALGIPPWYTAYRLAVDASTGVLEKYFTGTTIKHFTGQSLRSYILPLAPLAEQQRIVARIKSLFAQVEAIEAAVEVARRRVEQAEQAILSRAFRGELVPQDPNDEPASALLERIKTGLGVTANE